MEATLSCPIADVTRHTLQQTASSTTYPSAVLYKHNVKHTNCKNVGAIYQTGFTILDDDEFRITMKILTQTYSVESYMSSELYIVAEHNRAFLGTW